MWAYLPKEKTLINLDKCSAITIVGKYMKFHTDEKDVMVEIESEKAIKELADRYLNAVYVGKAEVEDEY